MASGIPTIYTNYSGHADFLNKANAGLPVGGVLQPESTTCIWRMVADLSQVIEAIRRLYCDRKLGSLLGANGRAFVEGFAPEIVVSKWHEIFQNLAATSGQAGAVAKAS
jgi:glycosyltransferase involved in cell wall biosynthesis